MAHDDAELDMYFHSNTDDILLFSSVRPASGGAYVLALLLIVVVGVFKEFLLSFRAKMLATAAAQAANQKRGLGRSAFSLGSMLEKGANSPDSPTAASALPVASSTSDRPAPDPVAPVSGRAHVADTGLYVFSLAVSYIQMLVVMTFNVGYCLAVLVGAATGHWFFGRSKSPQLQPGTGDVFQISHASDCYE